MSKNSYLVTLSKTPEASSTDAVHRVPAGQTQPVRISAQPGATYTLTDTATDKAPQQIHAQRRGKDLFIQFEDFRTNEAPDLIVENFYANSPGNFSGVAEDAGSYLFIPDTAQAADQIANLSEDATITQLLGGSSTFVVAAAPLIGAAGGLVAGPLGGIGGAAAAGAGLLAAAGGGGGGGSGGTAGAGSTAAVLSATVTSNATKLDVNKDTKLNKTESAQGVDYTLDLSSTADRALVESDLVITGGTLKPGSFQADATVPLRYTFSLLPTAGVQDGKLAVALKAGMVKSSTGAANVLTPAADVAYDTQPLTPTITNNLETLETIPGGQVDGKLNIAEATPGLRVKVAFSELPNTALVQGLFQVDPTQGSIRDGSFLADADGKGASFIVDPKPGTEGVLDVKLSASGVLLKDLAGNPITPANSATVLAYVPYDVKSPVSTVTSNLSALGKTIAGGKEDAILNAKEAAKVGATGEDPGLRITLTFDEAPAMALTARDFAVDSGSLRENTFSVSDDGKTVSFKVDPPAGSTGTLGVKLSAQGQALKDIAGNPLANPAALLASVAYDLQPITAGVKSNLAALQTGPGGKVDGTLNRAEAAAGVTVTVEFNEAVNRALTKDDFLIGAGAIGSGGVTLSADGKTATFVVYPTANSAGTLTVALSPTGLQLTDVAGNPLTVTAPTTSDALLDPLPFDVRQPTLAVATTPADAAPVSTLVNGPLVVGYPYDGAPLNKDASKVTFLGQMLGHPDADGSFTVPKTALEKLVDGFYTLTFDLEDKFGNQTSAKQVIEVDRGNAISDAFNSSKGEQVGTGGNDYFVDRAGSQTYNGADGGLDRFVWLKGMAGSSAATDRDTIKNFTTSNGSNAIRDVIDLLDLFGKGPTTSNLSGYLQARQVDTNGDSFADETRLYINATGQLNSTFNAPLAALESSATQVILLPGITKTLQQLEDSGNLVWEVTANLAVL